VGIIELRCPECGAATKAPPTAEYVTCEYCGTASRVQRRTRVFQIAQPPAPPPASAPQMPVAVQRAVGAVVLVVFLIAMAIIGTIAFTIHRFVSSTQRQVSQAFEASFHPMDQVMAELQGVGPEVQAQLDEAMRDANRALRDAERARTQAMARAAAGGGEVPRWEGGTVERSDGVVIGRIRAASDGSMRAAAFDRGRGAVVWESASLGTRAQGRGGHLHLVGDTVVFIDGEGRATGLVAADGATRWQTALGAAVSAVCDGGADRLRLRTRDRRWHELSIADGARDDGKDGPCAPP
jgi:hypothetical protein